jgi:hypothetical protein
MGLRGIEARFLGWEAAPFDLVAGMPTDQARCGIAGPEVAGRIHD